LDEIHGDLTFDVTKSGERYLKLNAKEQELKKNDVILKDGEGILASIIYGPARRTSITLQTINALYFAWCPYALDDEIITTHLNEILTNLTYIFKSVTSESQLIRPRTE
jgi:DNA/RNA-binding domain of Phe-tRNA-synthetase-like protein